MDSQAAVLIPGGLRWRSLVPLETSEGVCEVLYDLERNLLVEVPDVFHYHIAMALESGNPDETLLGWLASEDLLTYDRSHEPQGSGLGAARADELSELYPALGCVYFVEDRAHCRLSDGSDQAALETLDCLLGPMYGVTRLTIHLDGEGGRLSFDGLQRIVEATRARAEDTGREIAYELRLDAEAVTPELAAFLERHPFRVRVRCDGPPQPPEMMEALGLLRDHLPEKLTVHSVMREGRLLDLWQWAKDLGLEQIHVTRLLSRQGSQPATPGSGLRESELRAFRRDLATLSDEMIDALQAQPTSSSGRRPLLYEPITRVVRRISRDAGPSVRSGAPPCVGVVAHGHVFPVHPGGASSSSVAGPAPADPEELELGDGLGDGEVEAGSGSCRVPCQRCTSRRLCGRGLAADPALSGIERVDIWGRHCDFWRAEVEAGLLFYRRLRQIDPDYLLGLVGGSSDAFVDPVDTAADYFEWQTC